MDKELSEKLQLTPDLTLKTATDMAHQSELVKSQLAAQRHYRGHVHTAHQQTVHPRDASGLHRSGGGSRGGRPRGDGNFRGSGGADGGNRGISGQRGSGIGGQHSGSFAGQFGGRNSRFRCGRDLQPPGTVCPGTGKT